LDKVFDFIFLAYSSAYRENRRNGGLTGFWRVIASPFSEAGATSVSLALIVK
jgi:hypothetical protein